MRILIAESESALATFLQRSFEAENYAVDVAATAGQVRTLVESREYEAAILDLSLGNDEGLDVLRHVRAKRGQLPILVLTHRTRPEERAQVLDLGADDLLLKPFAFSELSARVRALLRRGGHAADALLRIDDLELSRVEHTVKRGGKRIDLTPKEFALLEYLMRNAGVRVTRAQIIENVWNLSFDTMTNVVDVYINYLRKKVDAAPEKKLIHTVRGVGYQLQAGKAGRGNAA